MTLKNDILTGCESVTKGGLDMKPLKGILALIAIVLVFIGGLGAGEYHGIHLGYAEWYADAPAIVPLAITIGCTIAGSACAFVIAMKD